VEEVGGQAPCGLAPRRGQHGHGAILFSEMMPSYLLLYAKKKTRRASRAAGFLFIYFVSDFRRQIIKETKGK
jgi:hypothetical protein